MRHAPDGAEAVRAFAAGGAPAGTALAALAVAANVVTVLVVRPSGYVVSSVTVWVPSGLFTMVLVVVGPPAAAGFSAGGAVADLSTTIASNV